MKPFLFALALFFLVLFFSSCALGPRAEPRTAGSCIHPAILGGAPFNLPDNAFFNGHHHLVVPAPDGSELILVGAICILEKK